MKQPLILWISALILTFLTGYIQSGTSDHYPVTGTIGIDEKKVSYRFEKIFNDKENYKFIIRTDNPDINSIVKWKKEDEENWQIVEMKKDNAVFIAYIPKQNAGEKILYYAEIYKDEVKYLVPDKPVTLLFRGYVPSMISFLSNFALFGGLILSFRIGLAALGGNKESLKIKKFTLFTTGFFFVYTIAVTPLRKSYELGAINKKVVSIETLFDVQALLLFVLWIIAMIVIFKVKNQNIPAIVFSVLTALIFLFIRI